MFEFITSLLASMGSLGVATLMLLENVFPPIPSEVIMPFAGYLAASGDLPFVSVVIAGTIGSVAGAFLWYHGIRNTIAQAHCPARQVADHLRARPRPFTYVVSAQWWQSGVCGPDGAGCPNADIRSSRHDGDAAAAISTLHRVGQPALDSRPHHFRLSAGSAVCQS